MEELLTKKCSKCGEEKSVTEFYKAKHKVSGLNSSCKCCCNISHKIYCEKNKKKLYLLHKKWVEKNREYMQKYKKAYRSGNSFEKKSDTREFKQLTKEERSEFNKNYYIKNKSRLIKNQKKYVNNNREKITKSRKKFRHTNINYKISGNLRHRVWTALMGISKSDKTFNLIGCNIEFLKQYLSSKFQPGMTWENYGDWHIDHIIPCASFDLTKEEEQRKCFHYTNLQPLWQTDNLSKGKKLIYGPTI